MEDVGLFIGIWSIVRPFGITGEFSHRFGMLCQEKSGNPGVRCSLPNFDFVENSATGTWAWMPLYNKTYAVSSKLSF
jgi:hypothetical protein